MAPPSWRPDGRELAFVAAGDPELIYYSTHHLAVVSADGGAPRILTRLLDRNVMSPVWASNGRAIYFLVEDDGNQHLARIETGSNTIERIVDGRRETTAFDLGGKDASRCSMASSKRPRLCTRSTSVATAASRITTTNGSASVKLGATEEISFDSKDGTRINGFIVKPPDYRPGRRYPTILWIHGGPVSQYANSFSMSVADLRVERLRRARRQSARQLGSRRKVRDRDLRRLGQQGHGRRARRESTTP